MKSKRDRLFDRFKPETLEKFKEYDRNNPHVYAEFKRLAQEMKSTGRKKCSAELIINKMRWDYNIETIHDDFKISNNFKPIYARLLVYREPKFDGFFDFKGLE